MRQQLGRQAVLIADDRELLDRLVHAVERARYAARTDHMAGLRQDAAALRAVLLKCSRGDAAHSAMAGSRLVDGLEWIDTTGERLRAHLPVRSR